MLTIMIDIDEAKYKQTIASLKEEINKLKQRLKSSHQVSTQEVERMRKGR